MSAPTPTPSASASASASASVASSEIDEDNLVQLSENQASKKAYPPGCPVWYAFNNSNQSDGRRTLAAKCGVVSAVFIDLSTKAFVFGVVPAKAAAGSKSNVQRQIYVLEENLAYSRNCPVTVRVSEESNSKELQGVILCPRPPNKRENRALTYSVAILASADKEYSEDCAWVELGVPCELISFRSGPQSGGGVASSAAAVAAESTAMTNEKEGSRKQDGTAKSSSTSSCAINEDEDSMRQTRLDEDGLRENPPVSNGSCGQGQGQVEKKPSSGPTLVLPGGSSCRWQENSGTAVNSRNGGIVDCGAELSETMTQHQSNAEGDVPAPLTADTQQKQLNSGSDRSTLSAISQLSRSSSTPHSSANIIYQHPLRAHSGVQAEVPMNAQNPFVLATSTTPVTVSDNGERTSAFSAPNRPKPALRRWDSAPNGSDRTAIEAIRHGNTLAIDKKTTDGSASEKLRLSARWESPVMLVEKSQMQQAGDMQHDGATKICKSTPWVLSKGSQAQNPGDVQRDDAADSCIISVPLWVTASTSRNLFCKFVSLLLLRNMMK